MTDQVDNTCRWVDLRSAVALTGVSRLVVGWAMAEGDVRYSTSRAGHEGVPMLVLEDVEALAERYDAAQSQ